MKSMVNNFEIFYNGYNEKHGRYKNFTFHEHPVLKCFVMINYVTPLDLGGRLISSETVIEIKRNGEISDMGNKNAVSEKVYNELLEMAYKFISAKRI